MKFHLLTTRSFTFTAMAFTVTLTAPCMRGQIELRDPNAATLEAAAEALRQRAVVRLQDLTVGGRGLKGPPWSAAQATGAPDTLVASDAPTAWAPLQKDGGPEWLEAKFDLGVEIAKVVIRETFNPGAITRVSVFTGDDRREATVASSETGLQNTAGGMDLELPWSAETGPRTSEVKIYLDTRLVPGWNEIDAIELVGRDGTRQWAASATASSSYADAGIQVRGSASRQSSQLNDPFIPSTRRVRGGAQVPNNAVIESLAARLKRLEDELGARERSRPIDERLVNDQRILGKSFLGVQISAFDSQTTKTAKSAEGAGVLVSKVVAGSAAETAGLKDGDVIVRINGETMREPTDVPKFLRDMEPGTILVITYLRGGAQQTVTARLRPRPDLLKDQVRPYPVLKTPASRYVIKVPWSPIQACGAPDTPLLGDFPTAWAPAETDAGEEWLQLGYETAVAIQSVVIFQSCGPGAVTNIEALTPDGKTLATVAVDGNRHATQSGGELEKEVSEAKDADGKAKAVRLEVRFSETQVSAKSIKVHLNTARVPGWNQIDAVELVGTDGRRQWARRATASSYFKQRTQPASGKPFVRSFQRAKTPDDVAQTIQDLSDRLAHLELQLSKKQEADGLPKPSHALRARSGLRDRHWGPEQACGAPDTKIMGDAGTAWAPKETDRGEEWLEVDYDRAVEIAELRIHQSYNPGGITRVTALASKEAAEARDAAGNPRALGQHAEETIWEGKAGPSEGSGSTPQVLAVQPKRSVRASAFRIYFDTAKVPGWQEIDAVELLGQDGSRQWAAQAAASTSYAD